MALTPAVIGSADRMGFTGKGIPRTLQNMVRARKLAPEYLSDPISLLDPHTDLQWGWDYRLSRAPHSYFDYYFSGQDINCYIDGTSLPAVGGGMPIMEFAFNIQQQKQPVYGFWNYTYSAVMRGTRIVNGVFRIATRSTNYMVDLISQAAQTRMNNPTTGNGGTYFIRGLDIDEANIDKYWSRNLSDAPDLNMSGGKHLFSSHPPFNFVIIYGMQSPSISDPENNEYKEIYESYQDDTPLMADTNERLVEADQSNQSMRFIIENVELTGLQVEYGVDGQVCSEVYSFFARDMYPNSGDTQR